MTVSCECNTCYCKGLCINRNHYAGDFAASPELANKIISIDLKCKHRHPTATDKKFDCAKCKNKPICKIHNLSKSTMAEFFKELMHDIKTKCLDKLPDEAFAVEISCVGFAED